MRAVFLSQTNRSSPAVVVVGEGLIGSAVTRRLRRRAHTGERYVPSSWEHPDFGADCRSLLEGSGATSVEVVWSAGVFGMSSSLEVDRMAAQFEANVSSIVEAARTVGPVRVHLASSAGALGCPSGERRFDAVDSPYKSIKAAEEDIVRALDVAVRIHRVTSVFGPPSSSGRAGLVGMLLSNALQTRETALFARTTTMRNYIHAEDVGEAIVRATLSASNDMTLLAAIRSHPMNEVVATAGRVLRRSVPVAYRPPSNHHDMIFNPRAVSDLVPQRSLSAGMRLVNEALISA